MKGLWLALGLTAGMAGAAPNPDVSGSWIGTSGQLHARFKLVLVQQGGAVLGDLFYALPKHPDRFLPYGKAFGTLKGNHLTLAARIQGATGLFTVTIRTTVTKSALSGTITSARADGQDSGDFSATRP